METRYMNDYYTVIASAVLEKEPILQDIVKSQATIVYLSSDKPKTAKGKTVFAECEKVADKNKCLRGKGKKAAHPLRADQSRRAVKLVAKDGKFWNMFLKCLI